MADPLCPSCKQNLAVSDFIAACSHYWRGVDVVRFRCPSCGDQTEARIENDRITLGYVYAAGSPHFCGMVDVPVDGLQVWPDGPDLKVNLGEKDWIVPGMT